MLDSLTKDDLKKHLKMSKKLEQMSFLSGVELLRMHEYNREVRPCPALRWALLLPACLPDSSLPVCLPAGRPGAQSGSAEPSLLDQQRCGGLAEGHPAGGEPLVAMAAVVSPECCTNLSPCLQDYVSNLLGSGVHGALLFLERGEKGRFSAEHLAQVLQLPGGKSPARKHLSQQMARLFREEGSE